MWQGLQTITGYKGKHSHELPSDTSLPDELNHFYALFEASYTEACMRASAVPDDCGLLNEALQINILFGDIKKDFIEQNYHLWYLWDILECQQKKIFKGKAFIISLFLSFVALGWGCALRYLSLVLNILHSVLNLIICLHIRIPEDWLEMLFDMFGWSLPVTFGIPLSACWTNGMGGLLTQTRQLNWLFGDIKDFIEQNNHFLCSWDPWDCKQRKIKFKWFILSLIRIFVMPLCWFGKGF